MQNKINILIALLILFVMGSSLLFTVHQTERALKLRLGKVVSADYGPGLHFKLPVIDTISIFDARIQTLDAPPELFLTLEKKNLIVDSFVKWRIINDRNEISDEWEANIDVNAENKISGEEAVVRYFKTVGGSEQRAGRRLSEIIADGLRREFGKRTIQEVVSGDRAQIMQDLTKDANKRAQKFGIQVVDVRVKRIELPKEVSSSVYQRMEAERERIAKKLRSRGEAEAVRIRAEADRKSVEVVAQAERDAERIRGEGDATSADTYAQAYMQDAEFYAFYRSLNAYKKSLADKSDIMLIQPDSDFFNYFNRLNPNLKIQTDNLSIDYLE